MMKWSYKFTPFKTAEDQQTDFMEPYFKDEFQFEIADVDRYATDKYFADLTLQETDKMYSLGFQMYNYQVGITGAVLYWHYDKDEFDRAKRTFKKAKAALRKTMRDIEYYRPPMAVITPMVRAALQPIDIAKKERSGQYFYNWFETLPKEPDWRESLYGNRYPGNVIQPMDAFWNIDEQGKSIVSQGTSSRNRVLRYKPQSSPATKYANETSRLRQLLSDVWQIGAGGAAGGILAWLLSLGIPPAQLEQQLQQGAMPQDILSQVSPENLTPVPIFEPPNDPVNEGTPIPDEESVKIPVDLEDSVDIDSGKATMPRGIRNNNPGNLVRNNTAWQGMAEQQSDERFVTFESPEYGIRAMARVLRTFGKKYNLRTIEQIISRWSPSSENETDAYIAHISQRLGISPNTPLDLNDDEILKNLLQVMIRHENGINPYNDETISKGIALERSGETHQGSFRHAYQEIGWAKARLLVRKLMQQGLQWPQIVQELLREGVPKKYFGRLNTQYLVDASAAFADCDSCSIR